MGKKMVKNSIRGYTIMAVVATVIAAVAIFFWGIWQMSYSPLTTGERFSAFLRWELPIPATFSLIVMFLLLAAVIFAVGWFALRTIHQFAAWLGDKI